MAVFFSLPYPQLCSLGQIDLNNWLQRSTVLLHNICVIRENYWSVVRCQLQSANTTDNGQRTIGLVAALPRYVVASLTTGILPQTASQHKHNVYKTMMQPKHHTSQLYDMLQIRN